MNMTEFDYSKNSLVRYLITTIYSVLRSTSLNQNFSGVSHDKMTSNDIIKFLPPKSVQPEEILYGREAIWPGRVGSFFLLIY
jgi:hypothetical protein